MHPTPFQKKICWAALTALAFVAMGGAVTLVGILVVRFLTYLQPVLIPIAVAAILAFLLEPIVRRLIALRISRLGSIIIVYAAFTGAIVGILIWILPPAYHQGTSFIQNFGIYSQKAQTFILSSMEYLDRLSEVRFFKETPDAEAGNEQLTKLVASGVSEAGTWLQQKFPVLAEEFTQRSIGGFLGGVGFLLSMILVPIFLFFFLKESPSIAQKWSRYLPLRASPLKNEIVSLVSEINSYLISFFRGQLVVSLIDGILIATALLIMGLDFAILIGLLVAVLGLIPYLGMLVCWIPAVLIAATQFQDWIHPLAVTAIFILANNLDSMFIAPKIVGDSVGLHPLTVIISVLAWSIILGGILGALLAVPLTATLKVVLKRYFWDRPPSAPLHPEISSTS